MEVLNHVHDFFYAKMGNAFYYALIFLGIIGLVAQWRLYEKANQPGIASIIPILNVIVFLRIVGRPAKHAWLLLVPFYGQFYFLPKVWIEICQSFGKRSTMDYVLVILLNVLYILNLGMSYESRYLGPVYGNHPLPPPTRLSTARPQLA